MDLNDDSSNSCTVVPGCCRANFVSYWGTSQDVIPSPTIPTGQMHVNLLEAFTAASRSWHAALGWQLCCMVMHSLMLTFLQSLDMEYPGLSEACRLQLHTSWLVTGFSLDGQHSVGPYWVLSTHTNAVALSSLQSLLHPSLLNVLPSSHSSPGLRIPSEHCLYPAHKCISRSENHPRAKYDHPMRTHTYTHTHKNNHT